MPALSSLSPCGPQAFPNGPGVCSLVMSFPGAVSKQPPLTMMPAACHGSLCPLQDMMEVCLSSSVTESGNARWSGLQLSWSLQGPLVTSSYTSLPSGVLSLHRVVCEVTAQQEESFLLLLAV